MAPLDYSKLIMAAILGYLFFDEVPAVWVWIGAPLLIAAIMIISWREYFLNKQLSSPVPE